MLQDSCGGCRYHLSWLWGLHGAPNQQCVSGQHSGGSARQVLQEQWSRCLCLSGQLDLRLQGLWHHRYFGGERLHRGWPVRSFLQRRDHQQSVAAVQVGEPREVLIRLYHRHPVGLHGMAGEQAQACSFCFLYEIFKIAKIIIVDFLC